MKSVIPDKRLYQAPEGDAPPPLWIRALLVLTCTGVSFAHGSNDGQKGMGLIMLILVGTVPTGVRIEPRSDAAAVAGVRDGVDIRRPIRSRITSRPNAVIGDARDDVTTYIRTTQFQCEHHAGAAHAGQ